MNYVWTMYNNFQAEVVLRVLNILEVKNIPKKSIKFHNSWIEITSKIFVSVTVGKI